MKKDKSKNKKNIMIVVCAALIYIVVAFLVVNKMSEGKDTVEEPSYLIINGENFYEYSDKQIKTISFQETDYSKISFNIYKDDAYYKDYVIVRSTSGPDGISFNKRIGNKTIRLQNDYLAITDDIELIEFEEEDFDDEDIRELEVLMADKSIYNIGTLARAYKVTTNVDTDEELETIYVASNYDYVELKENLFSIIYIKDDSEIKVLEEYFFTAEEHHGFILCNLKYILDIDKDGTYTLVVSSSDDDESIVNFYTKIGNYYSNMRLM